jgi:hypothetical protein
MFKKLVIPRSKVVESTVVLEKLVANPDNGLVPVFKTPCRNPSFQELTLESGTDQLTGQDKPQQERAGREGRAGQSRTSRTGRDK